VDAEIREVWWMSVIGSTRAMAISGAAGFGLVAGALFIGAPLVSADEPTPTPQAGQDQAAPGTQGESTEHAQGDCPGMDQSAGSGTSGVGLRGMARGFRQ
jgi:hypothetical protein